MKLKLGVGAPPSQQQVSALSSASSSSQKDNVYLYAGVGAGVLLCLIFAGLAKYRANMKKRRSPYEQWIDYAASKQEGRQYRADTHIREPPTPVAMPGRKQDLNVEMRDVIPKLKMQHDLRDHMPAGAGGGEENKRAKGSISQFDVTDFYRLSKGKKSSLSGLPETSGAGEEEEEDGGGEGGADDTFGDHMRSPTTANRPVRAGAKSRSVFGSFNPLVSGAAASPQSLTLAGVANATPAGLLGAQVNNPLAGNRISHRINLSTPVQSPASLAAARDSAERIHEHGFEDEEGEEDDEAGVDVEFYGEVGTEVSE